MSNFSFIIALGIISFKMLFICSNTSVFYFLVMSLSYAAFLFNKSSNYERYLGLIVVYSTFGMTITSFISTLFSTFIFFDLLFELDAIFRSNCVEEILLFYLPSPSFFLLLSSLLLLPTFLVCPLSFLLPFLSQLPFIFPSLVQVLADM